MGRAMKFGHDDCNKVKLIRKSIKLSGSVQYSTRSNTFEVLFACKEHFRGAPQSVFVGDELLYSYTVCGGGILSLKRKIYLCSLHLLYSVKTRSSCLSKHCRTAISKQKAILNLFLRQLNDCKGWMQTQTGLGVHGEVFSTFGSSCSSWNKYQKRVCMKRMKMLEASKKRDWII